MNANTATTTPSDATGSQGAAGLVAVLRPVAIDIGLPLGIWMFDLVPWLASLQR